jgi:hypothetical protein
MLGVSETREELTNLGLVTYGDNLIVARPKRNMGNLHLVPY